MPETVELPYREETMSTGVTVRIYPVPETLIWRVLPEGESEPEVPLHEMKTATGAQSRLAKEGDPEWEPYLRQHKAWQEKKDRLEEDARLVLALRGDDEQPGFDWPADIEAPEYLRLLVEDGELPWPTSRTQQRAFWFRSVIGPAADDVAKIMDAMSILSGVEENLVRSFRARLQSQLHERLLAGPTEFEGTLQPVLPEGEGGDQGGESASPVP